MSYRKFVLPVSALALVALALPGSAQADNHRSCAGTGQATLSAPIRVTPSTANVGFSITVGCAGGGSVTATGTLSSAACGNSTGSGSLSTGETFSITTAGGAFALTGQVTGGGNVVADVTVAGNSCVTGATVFRTTGAISY